MNKNFKRTATVLSVLALTGAGVMGSLAYLQEKSNTVTNTFTAQSNLVDDAQTNFTLKEHDVVKDETNGGYNLEANAANTEGTETAVSYQDVIPGVELEKDPTVYLKDLNVKSYLFIKEVTSLSSDNFTYSVDNMVWDQVDDLNNVWVLKAGAIDPFEDENKSYSILNGKKIDTTANFEMNAGASENLVYEAYLVQADGFTNAEDAWKNTYGAPATPTPDTSESTGA